jgi:hypothetical protein
VRTSATTGIIRVAAAATGCACAYNLWTTDRGRRWSPTRAIADGLIGRGTALYWIGGGGAEIRQVTPWPPTGTIRSQTVATINTGTIVSVALVPGGVAALVKAPSARRSSILIARPGQPNQVQLLPAPPGMLISQTLHSSGSTLIVDGTVFDGRSTTRVRWSSIGDLRWERLTG